VRSSRGGFEEELVRSGTEVRLSNGVAGVAWGEGPRTLLVHGWCGRGTQLGGFVAPLLTAGRSVMAIDCWGHGDSPGTESHGVKFSECILLADKEFGSFHSVVGHSVGGAATLIAINRGLRLERVVLLAPPSIARVVREFGGRNDFSDLEITEFTRELSLQSGFSLEQVDMVSIAPRIQTPILIFHDEADRTVSIKSSEQFVERCASAVLRKVPGVGHLRIMRSKEIIRQSVSFIVDGTK
jgi:pimeloyl-ACP methyl ester carboxylesterase